MKQIINLGYTVHYADDFDLMEGVVIGTLTVLSKEGLTLTAYATDAQFDEDPRDLFIEPDRVCWLLEEDLFFSKEELKKSIIEKIKTL